MDGHVKKQWDLLVELADGRATKETRDHLVSCERCRVAYDQILIMKEASSYPFEQPPQSLVESAIAIAQPNRSRLKLVSPRLSALGARTERVPAQVLFGQGDLQVRAMYSPTTTGWDVFLSLNGRQGTIFHAGERFETDDRGRVLVPISDIAVSELVLETNGAEFLIPSPIEVEVDGV